MGCVTSGSHDWRWRVWCITLSIGHCSATANQKRSRHQFWPIRSIPASSSGQSEAFPPPVLANQKRSRQFWPIRSVPTTSSGQSGTFLLTDLANQKRSHHQFWPIRNLSVNSSGLSGTFPPVLANQKRSCYKFWPIRNVPATNFGGKPVFFIWRRVREAATVTSCGRAFSYIMHSFACCFYLSRRESSKLRET